MSDERLYSIKLGLDATSGARNMRQFHSMFNKTLKDMGEQAPDIKAFKEMAKQAEASETALDGVDHEMAGLVRSYNKLKAEASARDKLKFIPDKEIERQVAAVRKDFATLKKSGSLSAKEIERAYQQTEIQIRSLRGETEKSAIKTEGALKRIARQALAVTAAFFGFRELGRVGIDILKTGDAFEKLDKQLEALTGSTEKAQEASQWIQEFTQNTPLQLEQVTEQFTKLKAFGIDPMDGSLQKLVDANERLGGGMDRLNGIVLAFGQAWGKQKLQGEELLQLVERGIPVWELLEKVTGKNTAELQKMSSAGELGRDTIKALMDELGRQSAGAAAANMSLLSGYVSNLKDEWQLFLREIADAGVLDYAKENLKALLTSIKELSEDGTLNQWAQSISDGMVATSNAIKSTSAFIIKFKDEILLVAQVTIAAKLLPALATAGKAIGGFGSQLKITASSATLAGGRISALRAVMLTLPSTVAITLGVVGIKAAIVGIERLTEKLAGVDDANQRLKESKAQYFDVSLDLAAAYREEANALETVRDVQILSTEQILKLSAAEQNAYAQQLNSIKEYLTLKTEQANLQNELGVDLDKETQRAVELYNKHGEALKELATAQEFVAKALGNGLTIEAQKAVDRLGELEAKGMKAADALKVVGGSLNLNNMDDLRTLKALLKEVADTGTEMSAELKAAFSAITGDIGYDDLDHLRTVIDATFDNAGDKARALGAILQTGLADELGRLGLSFEELQTGIDASAQQAVDDFKSVVEVIKESGIEASIAEQKIIEAYQAASNQAGDSTEAVEQLNNSLSEAGKDGLVSTQKATAAIEDQGSTAEKTSGRIVKSTLLSANGLRKIEDAASDATDALEENAAGAAQLAQMVGAYVTNTTEHLQNLSAQTAQMFNQRMGINTAGVVTEIEAMEQALNNAEAASINAQTSMGSFAGSVTGLNDFVQDVEVASNEVSASFYRQKLAYTDMMAEINAGHLTGYQLVDAAEQAVNRFNQLNQSDLSALENAIAGARQEMDALNDSATSTLGSLQDELDRLQGNQDAIDQRKYDQKKSELKALIREAEVAQNSDAAADYREALNVLEQIRREKDAQRIADQKSKSEQNQVSNEPTKPNNKPQNESQQASRAERSVNLNLPGGGSSKVSGSADDIDNLLNYLAEAQLSTAE